MLDRDFVLKNNELFVVGREGGASHGRNEAGIYLRDTRFLSGLEVTVGGGALETLSAQTLAADEAIVTQTIGRDHPSLPPASLVVRIRMLVGASVRLQIEITTFGPTEPTIPIRIRLATDFRDMFDVRGMTPTHRVQLERPIPVANGVRFGARGGDGARYETSIAATPTPPRVEIETPDDRNGETMTAATLVVDCRCYPGEITVVMVDITPHAPGVLHRAAEPPISRLTTPTGNPDLDALVAQSERDLAMLQTDFPEGSIPAAGIPWFVAPFGRDSLIVALQTMHAYPERAWATLELLAANQGTTIDPWREEEPGKILHEMRYGDMARTGQVPHGPYFGSIDATPLFAMTFARMWLADRDDERYARLLPHVEAALTWIERYGDLDGDGLVEFGAKSGDGLHIVQQGWKDSSDSLHWANGDAVSGPIALVEVQGYVYAAWSGMADVAAARGEAHRAACYRANAERVRRAVESRFWLEREGCYAQALDGDKRPVDAVSSNPGHLLFCGLPSTERAQRQVARLSQSDLLTHWGIRTLSSQMATYNPMSYHNGSIWPHDNSLILRGCADYGFDGMTEVVASCLMRLAHADPQRQLSELYCGFDRTDEREGPVLYPVSCRPQAWAAGCGPLIAHTIAQRRP